MKLKLALLFFLGLYGFSSNAQKQSINWMSIENALEASAKNPKKIIIDIYTDWCGWCKVMDRETFGNEDIIKYINENYYAVKLNAEKQTSFSYKGQLYNLEAVNGKTINSFVLAISNGSIGYPALAYLDEQQNLLTLLTGYQKKEQLLPILKFLHSDSFKSMTYEEFLKKESSTTTLQQ